MGTTERVKGMTDARKKPRPRRSFTDEFKAGAVRLVLEEGKTIGQVCRDLDLTPSALGYWVQQAKADAGQGPPAALTTSEREELARLRRRAATPTLRRKRSARLRPSTGHRFQHQANREA